MNTKTKKVLIGMVALSMIGTITYEDKYIPKYEIMTHSKDFVR